MNRVNLKYYVFHLLEGVLNCMDEEKSKWTGDFDIGIPGLVLNYGQFEQRPMFWCNHIYVPLMRDDVKNEFQKQQITGFEFLEPERYCCGEYGPPPDFE